MDRVAVSGGGVAEILRKKGALRRQRQIGATEIERRQSRGIACSQYPGAVFEAAGGGVEDRHDVGGRCFIDTSGVSAGPRFEARPVGNRRARSVDIEIGRIVEHISGVRRLEFGIFPDLRTIAVDIDPGRSDIERDGRGGACNNEADREIGTPRVCAVQFRLKVADQPCIIVDGRQRRTVERIDADAHVEPVAAFANR